MYRQAFQLISLCFQFPGQAIGKDAWENGEPLQEEEDLWDDARLQVCIGYALSRLNVLSLKWTIIYYISTIMSKEG